MSISAGWSTAHLVSPISELKYGRYLRYTFLFLFIGECDKTLNIAGVFIFYQISISVISCKEYAVLTIVKL